MTTKKMCQLLGITVGGATAGTILGTAAGGGIGGLTGAVSGATGAAILKAAGYAGYSVIEATQTVAAGNAILGGTAGGLIGCLGGIAAVGSFFTDTTEKLKSSSKQPVSKGSTTCGILVYAGAQTLGGLIGSALFTEVAASSMTLGQIAASSSVGAGVTAIPITVGLLCCLGVTVVIGAGVVAGTVALSDAVEEYKADKKVKATDATEENDERVVEEDNSEVRIGMNA
ncbi:TPA: hypothetical protein ACK8SK_001246 [Legionella pneumophila]|nr:hypothetical protein [Legionella pneumophila]